MSHNPTNPTVPHYALPNVSSRLPEYVNADQEAIRAAFVPNSYRTISTVRVQKAQAGIEADPMHNNSSMLATIDAPAFKAGNGERGLFSEFVYESSPYDVTALMTSQSRKLHDEQMKQVSARPFVVQSAHSVLFGKSAQQPGGDLSGSGSGTSSVVGSRDPFDAVRDDEYRHKWLEEHRSKPFLPAGKEKPLAKPTRAMLTDIMTHVYRVLCEDWNEAHPTVLATSEDLIVVYFAKDGIKNEAGIQAYMSVFARRNDVVLSYDLRRVNEGWNVATGDGHLMFTFRPPWVRQRSFLAGSGGLGASAAGPRGSVE
jgi:hypothetical protein